MQLEFRFYGGSLGLWRVRRTARRPLAVTPRGMECRCVARRNTIVGLEFCLTRAAIFVTCGLVSLILVPCFTMSANFSSGTYLRLILAILSVFVVFALVIFSLIFLRNSTSFGHPLYDAGCPKFLQFMQ